jgi:glycosyltransferase involved in cell wall biosynthesis
VDARTSNVDVVDRRIPVRALNFAWNRLEAPTIETLCGRDFDIVHSPHALLTPSRGARRIISIHDLFFFKRPALTGAEIRRDYAPLVKDHASRADGIICPSEHTARDIQSLLSVPREKIKVTFYGVDPSYRLPPDPPEVDGVLERLALPSGSILYLGSGEKRKNLDTLIAAHQRLRQRTPVPPALVLIGPGPKEPVDGVFSTGYLTRSDVRAVMASAACLALVSLDEGFGFPVAEAMCAGLPVVCSRGSSLEEIAGGAAELVSDILDAESIASSLERVLRDDSRRGELRALGLARSRVFDWSTTAQQTLSFYREILGR